MSAGIWLLSEADDFNMLRTVRLTTKELCHSDREIGIRTELRRRRWVRSLLSPQVADMEYVAIRPLDIQHQPRRTRLWKSTSPDRMHLVGRRQLSIKRHARSQNRSIRLQDNDPSDSRTVSGTNFQKTARDCWKWFFTRTASDLSIV
jgi:hypothetical protein